MKVKCLIACLQLLVVAVVIASVTAEEEVCNTDTNKPSNEDEKDPMLRAMPMDVPPYYFDAYVRADISSFYREPPGSRTEQPIDFSLGQAGKFINLSPHPMKLYVEQEEAPPKFLTDVRPFQAGAGEFVSPPGTEFYLERSDTAEIVCRFLTEWGTANYYYDPHVDSGDDQQFAAKQGKPETWLESLDSLTPPQRNLYDAQRYNLKFATLYKNFTGGSEWLATYPPSKVVPPYHKMWRADYFGQEHVVETKETHFVRHPPVINGLKFAVQRDENAPVAFPELRTPHQKSMNLTLKAVSCAPRAFQVDNFLSDVEVDHILQVMREYKESDYPEETLNPYIPRTKKERLKNDPEIFVPRIASPIFDAVYRRMADVVRIDEALLRQRSPDEAAAYDGSAFQFAPEDEWKKLAPISERMRMIHYVKNGTFAHHHDFGYGLLPATRAINFCLYLNDVKEGGTTSFPRWRRATDDSSSMDMKPAKGRALFFYLTTPDSNLDDLSQHSGRSVVAGEKRFNNIWIWNQPIEEPGQTIDTK